MQLNTLLKRQFIIHRTFVAQFISIVVGLHASFILTTTLLDQLAIHHGAHLSELVFDVPLLIGLSLLYLSRLLWRHKKTAWSVTMLAYAFYVGVESSTLFMTSFDHLNVFEWLELVRQLALPLGILLLLYISRREFVVRSDIPSFRSAVRFSALILTVALFYGTCGFLLLDKSDFHQEIGLGTAAHYTIDQFDLTTSRPLQVYTKRGHVFTDSLSVVSIGAIGYTLLSLFQPLKGRLHDQRRERQLMLDLLSNHPSHSEDFFKLWPHDKLFFFDDSREAGLAFHVSRGVALCLGDPAGSPKKIGSLLKSFEELCYGNDWLPAMIHVQENHRKVYEKHGYTMQKLGQEAVIDLAHFQSEVSGAKYFRQIRNKFAKQGYSSELLSPPHHPAVLERLKAISDQWLSRDGRVERGYVMGYYSEQYIQQCQIMVARDAAGTIQTFINLVPATFDSQEATFDMLRHSESSLGNSNDFMLMSFIDELVRRGYTHLNLGLCPLVGLEESEDSANSVIDGVLRFAYANGDRFYSFTGLRRFKAKYEPEWRDRYIAYQGGVVGFSRTTTALMRAMRVK